MTEQISDRSRAGPFDHVDWRQSAIYGAGAWLVGVVCTYLVVTVSGVDDAGLLADESTLDLSVWIFYESIGGAFDLGGAAVESVVTHQYGALDSNLWGAGVVVHHLIPIVVLTIAGYVLADKYRSGEIGDGDMTPVAVAVGGTSLAGGFAAASIVGLWLFGGDPAVHDTEQLLFVSVLFPIAFAAFGAGLRARVRVFSPVDGLLGGIAAVLLGTALWYVAEDISDAVTLSDLSGLADYLGFLGGYFGATSPVPGATLRSVTGTHALSYGDTVPEWYVLAGITVVSAAIAYRAETDEWLLGAGRGARLGIGYFAVTLVVTLGAYGSYMNDRLDHTSADRATLVTEANAIFGATAPRIVFVGGIIWAVVFGGIGGAIGAKALAYRGADVATEPATSDPGAAE